MDIWTADYVNQSKDIVVRCEWFVNLSEVTDFLLIHSWIVARIENLLPLIFVQYQEKKQLKRDTISLAYFGAVEFFHESFIIYEMAATCEITDCHRDFVPVPQAAVGRLHRQFFYGFTVHSSHIQINSKQWMYIFSAFDRY